MKKFDLLYKIAEALEPSGNQRMAACIVKKKRLVSIGFNKNKTHPLMAKFCKHKKAIYLHAEIDAIINAKEDIRGATMYVLRVRRAGERGLAKPCPGCAKAIKFFGIKKVYHT